MTEIWRGVVGYEDLYEVSNLGRLRGARRQGSDGRVLQLTNSPCGYKRIRLYRNGVGTAKKLHRLVLEAFVGPCPPGMEGCHNNGRRDDNVVSNLRWASRVDNAADAKTHGTAASGERNGSSKLTLSDVETIRLLRAAGLSYGKIAIQFKVAAETVRSAAIGETWG